MKKYFLSVMKGKRHSVLDGVVKSVLVLLSGVYGAVIRIWAVMFRAGILKSHKVNAKVISVGNITLGGTGKTPLVLFIAERMKAEGKRPAVIIRGYGDDEWKMLKKRLGMIPVYVGRERVKLAAQAVTEHSPDAIILDDGFQHRALKRDVNIALIDATIPLNELKLFPRGVLREPVQVLKDANVVVLNKCDISRKNTDEYKQFLSREMNGVHVLQASYKPLFLRNVPGNELVPLDILKGKRIALVAAIANPEYFKFMLKSLGALIVHEMEMPDHHKFTQSDIDSVRSAMRREFVNICVTTEKDRVKLEGIDSAFDKELLVLDIGISFVGGEGVLDKWIL